MKKAEPVDPERRVSLCRNCGKSLRVLGGGWLHDDTEDTVCAARMLGRLRTAGGVALGAAAAVVLLVLNAKQYEAHQRELNRPRWTDANRWE